MARNERHIAARRATRSLASQSQNSWSSVSRLNAASGAASPDPHRQSASSAALISIWNDFDGATRSGSTRPGSTSSATPTGRDQLSPPLYRARDITRRRRVRCSSPLGSPRSDARIGTHAPCPGSLQLPRIRLERIASVRPRGTRSKGSPAAGAAVLLYTGVVHRPVSEAVRVRTTLGRGRLRVPYWVLGRLRSLRVHDRLVARRLPELADRIDVVHVWPLGARETLNTAHA